MAVPISIEMQTERLNSALMRVEKLTGHRMVDIVNEASRMFLVSAGKAMPPVGRVSHSVTARKRAIYQFSANRAFNIEQVDPASIQGRRKKGQGIMYGMQMGPPGKNRSAGQIRRNRRLYWNKTEARKNQTIATRGIAKGQFWRALQNLGFSPPRGIYVAPKAAQKVASNVTTTRQLGRDPFIRIVSTIQTAARYRPIAERVGLKSAANQVSAWGRRVAREMEKRFV